ncbi:response regulator transcription factor [Arachidicoccus soli]|uniref:DNA-binding response regulator n=1 Tax=Arachidicoccus soli TaxID=2341117 RepID=A0A386HSJ9_9BACT|nr:response regulator transcription factor [Arachidicoccus soli]AYD48855.1 DNA-binding response regulator [Arachidicoccus soli]
MKILIAEDEPLLLKIIEMHLKKNNYEIIMATDGREAIRLIELHRPDIIISDILMPYVSGLEIIADVRQRLKSNAPIIVLSGLGQENTVVKAFKLGVDDYITKPFSPTELLARIRRLAGNNKNVNT